MIFNEIPLAGDVITKRERNDRGAGKPGIPVGSRTHSHRVKQCRKPMQHLQQRGTTSSLRRKTEGLPQKIRTSALQTATHVAITAQKSSTVQETSAR